MLKNRLTILLLSSISILPSKIFSQLNIDSLILLAESNAHDTIRNKALLDICWELKASKPELALEYGEKALDLSRKINDENFEATALKNIGTIHLFLGNYSKSESYYAAAIRLFNHTNNDKGLSGCYNNLGLVKELKGEFELAQEHYQKSLTINEKIDNKTGIASSLTNIGNILQKQGNYRSSILYYLKALKIKEELHEKIGIADAYNNIGALYEKQSAYDQAIKNYQKALVLYMEMGEKRKSGMVLHNLGYIQSMKKQYESAMDYYEKALELRIEYGEKQGMASTILNIGEIYHATGKLKEAFQYYSQSLSLYNEIGNSYGVLQAQISLSEYYNETGQSQKSISQLEPVIKKGKLFPEELKHCYKILSKAYYDIASYKQAYIYQEKYILLKDSLGKEENTKNILQIQLDYEFQKKQHESEIEQQKQRIHDNAILDKRKMIIFILSIGLFAFLLLALFIYRSYLIKRRDNITLENQKKEIQETNNKLLFYQEELLSQKENLETQKQLIVNQRDQLVDKNQRINDSIQYAKRIQNSMLPPDQVFSDIFKDYFIIYKPKDIVSGDFYWFKETEDHILLAVADCTGHGVPGAFMSILGMSFLNEIVESGYINTSDILGITRKRIKQTLHHQINNNEPRDGMDISLCSINKKTRVLQFSGAYHSLLILNNEIDYSESLIEINGDKMPIGSHLKTEKDFTVHTHAIKENDKFYLFTDGYIDQFGGLFNRKFLPKKFKDILIRTKGEDLTIQKKVLIESLDNWMEDQEQIDDILVLGFKI